MDENDHVAWIDAPIWPEVGSTIELGPPEGPYGDTGAEVLEVRLQLNLDAEAHAGRGKALIVVVVRPLGRRVKRKTVGRASQRARARVRLGGSGR